MTRRAHQASLLPAASREDLEELRTLDRSGVFGILASFDELLQNDTNRVLRTTDLMNIGSVTGLSGAIENADLDQISDSVLGAFSSSAVEEHTTEISTEQVTKAEEIVGHTFAFYNERHQLPADIDWDFNPGTAHWSHDLNRFSFLTALTDAFFATGDTRFSRKAVDLILDWISKCDMGDAFSGTPYVFGSYLNQAIHCEAWTTCLLRLLPHGQISGPQLLRILKSLHDQVQYLVIVTNGHSGNWPTIGCRGILSVAAAFPMLKIAEESAHYAIQTLATQINDQVLPDGVQDELTPHYHWTVVDRLLGSLRYARQLGFDLESETIASLRKMIHYTRQTVVPDGRAQVAFNDSDPASVPQLSRALEHTELSDLLPSSEELGPELFPYAGVAILRQRSSKGDLYLAFDGGSFGRGHQHEDKLGFWLFAYGRNFLVDPGRHLYDWSEVSYYDYLKSTHAHSTLMIDGLGQNSRGRPDTWIPTEPASVAWQLDDRTIRASACYDLGYGPDNGLSVVHHREIVFVHDRFWVIWDSVEGEGTHLIESRFQFAPGELCVNGSTARTCFDDVNLLLWSLPSTDFTDVHVTCGRERPKGGWYSSGYGSIEPAPAFSCSSRSSLPFTSATLLYPYHGPVPPVVSFERDHQEVRICCDEIGQVAVVPGRTS